MNDPTDIRQRRANAEQAAQDERRETSGELAELLYVMRDKRGRDFIARLLRQTGFDEEAFSAEPATHAWREGRRSIGIELHEQVKREQFDLYLTMIKEQRE